ncbi:MAG: hypothetical protein VW995_04115, partial [Deltaproteobacteria bacterium]
ERNVIDLDLIESLKVFQKWDYTKPVHFSQDKKPTLSTFHRIKYSNFTFFVLAAVNKSPTFW